MAENETLDLWKDNSPRRRALLAMFRSSESTVASVSRALEDDLFSNGRKLVKRNILKDLLCSTFDGGVHHHVRKINGDEFAQVFKLEAAQSRDPKVVLENSLWFFVERVLDQIGQEVVPSRRWPDFVAFRNFAKEVEVSLSPAMHTLAQQLSQSPERSPRKPSQSEAAKEQWQHELRHLSLLPMAQ